jgi:hypothetical protein
MLLKEFVEKLIAKYGDDTVSMARDHKLNTFQVRVSGCFLLQLAYRAWFA